MRGFFEGEKLLFPFPRQAVQIDFRRFGRGHAVVFPHHEINGHVDFRHGLRERIRDRLSPPCAVRKCRFRPFPRASTWGGKQDFVSNVFLLARIVSRQRLAEAGVKPLFEKKTLERLLPTGA